MEINIDDEVKSYFDESSIVSGAAPTAIILAGGVAAGKTTLRRGEYSSGYVLIDAAEIFHRMSRGNHDLDFPDDLLEPLEAVGAKIAARAISERRNIVTEVIGDEPDPISHLISALKQKGYSVKIVALDCDIDEAIRRNETRGDNISAYFAEPFQQRWLTDACHE